MTRALDYFHIRNDLKKHTTDLEVDKHHKMNRLRANFEKVGTPIVC